MIFKNETHYYFLCKSIENNDPVIQLYKSALKANETPELLASQKLNSDKEMQLKIEARHDQYAFYYAEKNGDWFLLKNNVDGKFLSTKIAGGFVGCLYGLYATSLGKQSSSSALFNWFEYKGDDEVYK